MANAGSKAQKLPVGASATPGIRLSGRPNQGASTMGCMSYSPNRAATAQPAPTPMRDAQILQTPLALSARTVTASNVTPAARGPAAGQVPAGTSWNLSNASGSTETTISMRTVPATTGVTIRRRDGSQAARAIWPTPTRTVRAARRGGPPAASAMTEIAM